MYQKMQITHNFVETWVYENPPSNGNNKTTKHKTTAEPRPYSYTKSRNDVRSLIGGNFSMSNGVRNKLITLTFKNTKKFDISNLKQCNVRHRIFIKKVQAVFGQFKYVMIAEVQKERNAIHYHMLANLPYIEPREMKKFWPYGFSDIRVAGKVMKAIFYLTKYLTKESTNASFKGNRKVFNSRNLIRPIQVVDETSCAHLIREINQLKQPLVSRYRYKNQWLGTILYTSYVLNEKQLDYFYKVSGLENYYYCINT